MADEEHSDEYRALVEGLVPLDEAQSQQDDRASNSFEGLFERITGRSAVGFHVSFLTGAGLLLIAAALAALMPGRVDGDFWRVGRDTAADLLAAGNGAALPLMIAALALVALAGLAAVRGGDFGRGVVLAQPFIGGAGVAGVSLLWAGFLAFALLNFVVLLLIVTFYIVATMVIVALFIGMLTGLARR